MTFYCLYCTALHYLSATVHRVANVPSRRRLSSASTNDLIARTTGPVTIGDRAFPVAAAKRWTKLSIDITASQALTAFRRQLKTV